MFEFAGKWIDNHFIAFRDWLDCELVPAWRIWWKLASMRLGVLFAALATYMTAVPSSLQNAMDSLPDWMRSSLPTWIGPVVLGVLFFARFWDQTAKINSNSSQSSGPEHGAE